MFSAHGLTQEKKCMDVTVCSVGMKRPIKVPQQIQLFLSERTKEIPSKPVFPRVSYEFHIIFICWMSKCVAPTFVLSIYVDVICRSEFQSSYSLN